MSDAAPANDVLAWLRAGDEQTSAEVFGRFAHRPVGLARQRLPRSLHGKEDLEDAVQSALKRFYVRYAAGQYELTGWDDFWGLLTCITAHKCGHRLERFEAARRDIRREAAARAANDFNQSWEILARDPTSIQAVHVAELLEELHRPLSERDRAILTLRLQGEDVASICTQLQCSERTVFRVLGRIRSKLELQCQER